jgi:IclR family KDG regulon transcriptional repressor
MAESVKSAWRALRVIELLTEFSGLDFPDVCAELGIPKSSAHALLATMRSMGFVRLDEESRRYSLGPRLWEAGQAYLRDLDIPRLAMQYMQRARDELGETVQLAVLDGVENVYVGKIEADHPLQLVSKLGSRLPAYATGLGKALLAGLSDAEVTRRFVGVKMRAFTPRTVTDPAKLLEELARVRRQGYATDRGEYTEGVFCVAAPITGHTGTVAAMSVSVPDVRVTEVTRRRMVQVVTAEVARVSAALGAGGATGAVRVLTEEPR